MSRRTDRVRSGRGRHRCRSHCRCERLETRRLLAVSYNPANRIVFVTGSVFGDNVTLSRGVGNLLVVNENGVDTSFALADVDHVSVTLTGDSGNDLVTVNPLFSGSRALTVTVDTGNGNDTFRARAAGAGSAFELWDNSTVWTFPGVGTFTVNHFNTELSEAYGSDTAADSFLTRRIDVINPNLVVSAYGFGGNDTMTVGQEVINSTSGGNVLFTGGAGTDTMTVDASANGVSDPTSLRIINFRVQMSGSTRQAHFSETENVTVTGGSGNDFINFDAFHNGAHLAINGGAGNDIVNFTTTNLSVDVVNIASFNFDGGSGSDALLVRNDTSSTNWNYFRSNTVLHAQAPATGYNLFLGNTNNEHVYAGGGSGNDQFFIDSSPAGSTTQVDGMGGEGDVYYFGGGFTQNTSFILGAVEVWDPLGGVDSIIIDDRLNPVGRTVHVSEGSIGAGPGDDLLGGGGGSISYYGITGAVDLRLGSGADTVVAKPVSASLNLLGNNPTSPPGDTLKLAMATATNPVHSPSTPGNGFVNYADGPGIAYVSFETVYYDTVAPNALDITFNPTFGAQSLSFSFNDDVSASLSSFSLALNNDTTFTPVAAADIAYAFAGNVATFTFPGLAGTLASGDYTLTLNGATDAAGNDAIGDADYRFIWQAGDFGGDTIADVYRVKLNAVTARIEVYRNSIFPETLVAHADPLLLDMIALHGGANDDILHLDMVNGTPIPPDGLHFEGSAGDTDRIVVHGRTGPDNVTFDGEMVTANGRTVQLDGVEAREFDGAGGLDVLHVVSGEVVVTATQKLQNLAIEPGGVVSMASGGAYVLSTRQLSMLGDARLDLMHHDLVLDYSGGVSPIGAAAGGTYDGISGLLQSGRTDGTGIATSMLDAAFGLTTLGVAEAAEVLGLDPGETVLWNGVTVDATSVLVKYTYAGDANLDGLISGDDYTAIDFAIAVPGSFGYANGDFNYDGIVSGDDYSVIDFNIVAQGAPL